MDGRSALLSQLQGKKAKGKLKRVDTEAIAAQRAAERNKQDESVLVAQLMKRRAWLEDDDDDDSGTDSDWDSD